MFGGLFRAVMRFAAPVVGFAFGGPIGAVAGSGLGTIATGGNRHEALRSSLLAGAGGAIGGAFGGGTPIAAGSGITAKALNMLGGRALELTAGQALGGIAGSMVGGGAVDKRKEMFAQAMAQHQQMSIPQFHNPSSRMRDMNAKASSGALQAFHIQAPDVLPRSVGEALGTQPTPEDIRSTLIGRVSGFETPYMRMLNKRHKSYGYRNWKKLMKKNTQ